MYGTLFFNFKRFNVQLQENLTASLFLLQHHIVFHRVKVRLCLATALMAGCVTALRLPASLDLKQ